MNPIKLPPNTYDAKAYLTSMRPHPDKSLLNITNGNWDGIADIKNGTYSYNIKDIQLDFFIKIQNGSKLYVSLTGGAGGANRDNGPFFSRWTYYTIMDGSLLCIDDPMVKKYKLHHGWFFGTTEQDYAQIASDLVVAISKKLNVNNSDIVFISSSSGGTASIRAATYIKEKCTVIAINPQLDLANDSYSNRVSEAIGANIKINPLSERTNTIQYIKNNPDVNFFYIVNLSSKWDYEDNYIKLCNSMGFEPTYGISKNSNVVTWVYEGNVEPAHNAQDWKEFFPLINFVVQNINNDTLSELFSSINELWYNKYEEIRFNTLKETQGWVENTEQYKSKQLTICENYANNGYNDFTQLLAEIYSNKTKKEYDIDKAILFYKISTKSNNNLKKLFELYLTKCTNESLSNAELILNSNFSNIAEYHKALYKIYSDEKKPIYSLEKAISHLKKYADITKTDENILILIDLMNKSKDPSLWQNSVDLCKLHIDMPGGFTKIRLAYAYNAGKGIDKNPQMAEYYMRQAVNAGHQWAVVELINMLMSTSEEIKLKEAIELCQQYENIKGGHTKKYLGKAYRYGLGVQKNLEKAITYYQASSQEGNQSAELDLADLLLEGRDTNAWAESYKIYEKYKDSQLNCTVSDKLCKLYLEGKGCEKNKNKALSLMKPSSDKVSNILKLHKTNESLQLYDKKIIVDLFEQYETILVNCLQNNIFIHGTYTSSETIVGEKICIDDLKTSESAIITTTETADVLVKKYNLNENRMYICDESGKYQPLISLSKTYNNSIIITRDSALKSDLMKNTECFTIIEDLQDSNTNLKGVELLIKNNLDCNFLNSVNCINKVIYCDIYNLINKFGKYTWYDGQKINVADAKEILCKYTKGKELFEILSSSGYSIVVPIWRTIGDPHKVASLLREYKNTTGFHKIAIPILSKNVDIALLYYFIDKTFVLSIEEYDSLLWYIMIDVKYCEKNVRLCGSWPAYFGKNNTRGLVVTHTDAEQFKSTLGISYDSRFEIGFSASSILFNKTKNTRYFGSVLLNPYANTLFSSCFDPKFNHRKLIWNFFEKLAIKLKNLGLNVYTNTIQSQDAIPGTIPLNLSLIELSSACLYFRTTVSAMTGLIEAISLSGGNSLTIFHNTSHMRRFDMPNSYVISDSQSENEQNNNMDIIIKEIITSEPAINRITNEDIEKRQNQLILSNNPYAIYVKIKMSGENLDILKKYNFDRWDKILLIESLLSSSSKTSWEDAFKIAWDFYSSGEKTMAKYISNMFREGKGVTKNTFLSKQWLQKYEHTID